MSRDDTVGIVGAGAFGTALANMVIGRGGRALLWSRTPQVVTEINERHTNEGRLPGIELHADVRATDDPGELTRSARLIIIAVASTDVRNRLQVLGDHLDGNHLVVHAVGTLAIPGQVAVSEIIATETAALRIGALAGPALPLDLARGKVASMVAASRFDEVAHETRRLLTCAPALRIYVSQDLPGVELAAALSGAYTVAVGMADSLEVGAGTRAVLITRAVAEASRLLEAAGGDARTFPGLAGLGNLLVRSSRDSGEASKDYQLGLALGRGGSVDNATEGSRAADAGMRLADRLGVRAPVLGALAAVLSGKSDLRTAAAAIADTVAVKE